MTSRPAPRTSPRVRRGSAPGLLLAAARDLFAERGHRATTTRQIAERAGVSEDLIFRYYGSKDGLLQEAVIRPLLAVVEEIKADWSDPARSPGVPDRVALRKFVGRLFDLIADNKAVAMTMVHVLTEQPDEPGFLELRAGTAQLFEPLVPAFRDHVDDRDLNGFDPALTVRLVMIQVAASAAFLPGTYGDPSAVPGRDTVVDAVARLVESGIGPRRSGF